MVFREIFTPMDRKPMDSAAFDRPNKLLPILCVSDKILNSSSEIILPYDFAIIFKHAGPQSFDSNCL